MLHGQLSSLEFIFINTPVEMSEDLHSFTGSFITLVKNPETVQVVFRDSSTKIPWIIIYSVTSSIMTSYIIMIEQKEYKWDASLIQHTWGEVPEFLSQWCPNCLCTKEHWCSEHL